MKIEWATTANRAVDKHGILDLSGAGWATYDPGGFPGVIHGAVAGYIALSADEVGVPHKLTVRVTADADQTEMYADEYEIVVRESQVVTAGQIRAPFVIPLAVQVTKPMPVSIDLACRRASNGPIVQSVHMEFDVIEPKWPQLVDRQSESASPSRIRTWSARCIERALEAWRTRDHEGAALFAFVAFDSTAARAYPKRNGNGDRFKRLLRDNALVFERFGTPGLDVAGSRFPSVQGVRANRDGSPLDVADILYHAYRCGYIHGDDSIPNFILADGPGFEFAFPGSNRGAVLYLPKMAIIGMLAVCLLEPVNSDLWVDDECLALSWQPGEPGSPGRLVLPLNEWFGRRDDFIAYQQQYGHSSVTVDPGDQWQIHIDEPRGAPFGTVSGEHEPRNAL